MQPGLHSLDIALDLPVEPVPVADDRARIAQRLLGRQLDQIDQGELLARVDALATENHRLTEKLQQSAQEKSVLAHRNIELEEDIAAARTALRRMIKEQSSGV